MLRDSIALECAREVDWVFMMRHQPDIRPGCVTAGGVRMTFDPALRAHAEEIPVDDVRMARCFPGSIWRLMLSAQAKDTHVETIIIQKADG